jgi:7,8-dihydropterin-6-yl-methyl-4-(beta-D-ribofuranosyl)aminobenzene 5'-phosphate synthase
MTPTIEEDTVNGNSLVISYSAAALVLVTCTVALFAAPMASATPAKTQITVLYDAFGKTPAMQKDWGYSALIEYAGKRILFDTGNNPDILAQNAKAKGIDLSKLDFVVMSHRHGDHMGGLAYLLKGESRREDLRTQGRVRRIRRRLAKYFLP